MSIALLLPAHLPARPARLMTTWRRSVRQARVRLVHARLALAHRLADRTARGAPLLERHLIAVSACTTPVQTVADVDAIADEAQWATGRHFAACMAQLASLAADPIAVALAHQARIRARELLVGATELQWRGLPVSLRRTLRALTLPPTPTVGTFSSDKATRAVSDRPAARGAAPAIG